MNYLYFILSYSRKFQINTGWNDVRVRNPSVQNLGFYNFRTFGSGFFLLPLSPCLSAVHASFPGKTGLNPGAFKSGCILYS